MYTVGAKNPDDHSTDGADYVTSIGEGARHRQDARA